MSDNLEPRIRNVEEAMQMLTQLALRADERMDTLDQHADDFDKKMGELAEMQKLTEANLSALTSIVADLGRAQTRTEKALASLSEKLDRYISGRL